MDIDELIQKLEKIKEEHGNLYILMHGGTTYLPTLRHVGVIDETREGMEDVVVLSFGPIGGKDG